MAGSAVPLHAERANMDIPPIPRRQSREIPPSPATWSEAGVTEECMPMTGHGGFVATRFFRSGADSSGDAKLRSC